MALPAKIGIPTLAGACYTYLVDDAFWIRLALEEAALAILHDDVPVGAIAVLDGRVIGRGHNRREADRDPTAHAEIIALREASRAVNHWRLDGVTLYCTLEPCAMCAGAMILARWWQHYGLTQPPTPEPSCDSRSGCAGRGIIGVAG